MAKFNVLVVDDERDFLDGIVKRLVKEGLHCEGAQSGREGLKKVDTGEFDVVLLDVKMEGMDGIETLREIKRVKPLTEVVMLTGHASVETGINGMKLGAFDYLMKPIELEPLMEKLTDAYEKKKIHEAKIQQAQFSKHLSGHRGQVE